MVRCMAMDKIFVRVSPTVVLSSLLSTSCKLAVARSWAAMVVFHLRDSFRHDEDHIKHSSSTRYSIPTYSAVVIESRGKGHRTTKKIKRSLQLTGKTNVTGTSFERAERPRVQTKFYIFLKKQCPNKKSITPS